MKIIYQNNQTIISGLSDFDLQKTFTCGQCFRWNPIDNETFTGVAYGRVLKLRQEADDIYFQCSKTDFENIWRSYFDIDRDYAYIRSYICKQTEKYPRLHDFMLLATSYGKGIRILRQQPWETLCSFILSQNNNITRIKKIIDALCTSFGDKLYFEGDEYFSFPPAAMLADTDQSSLSSIKCGYRTGYLIKAADAVNSGAIDLTALPALPSKQALNELKKLPGVGDKVASCVMLFSAGAIDIFPVDVWMKRWIFQYAGMNFDPSVFSPYAGIAQQYIFHYMRSL